MALREYKFRGWDATGQKGWVYGDLVHNKKVTKTGLEDRVMVGGYEVVPESVGQWTGLKDNQEKDIYEGDLVNHPYVDPIFGDLVTGKDGEGVTSEVCFHDCSFVVKYDVDNYIYLDGFTRKNCVLVVGTVYEQNNKKQDTGIFAKKLHDCDLSVRALICLKAADIETVGDLCRCKKTDLLRLRNFGKRSLSEIEDFLHDNGLDFEMNI